MTLSWRVVEFLDNMSGKIHLFLKGWWKYWQLTIVYFGLVALSGVLLQGWPWWVITTPAWFLVGYFVIAFLIMVAFIVAPFAAALDKLGSF